MERMIPQEFRDWFARFSRPRAIWIQHSGWVPGTQRSPVPEATAQGQMEDIVIEWANAIRRARGWPIQNDITEASDDAPIDLGYLSMPADVQADIENQIATHRPPSQEYRGEWKGDA